MKFQKKVDTILKPNVDHFFASQITKPLIERKKVLDIGCWTGHYLDLVKDNCQAFGLDINKQAIKVARKKIRQAHFKVASCLKMTYPDEFFDVVTLWDVLEHLPEKKEKEALVEINRVLKRVGWFCLCTPRKSFLLKLSDLSYWILGHRHYSEEEIRDLLKNSGFEVLKIYNTTGIRSLLFANLSIFFKYIFHRPVPFFHLWQKFLAPEYKENLKPSPFLVKKYYLAKKI